MRETFRTRRFRVTAGWSSQAAGVSDRVTFEVADASAFRTDQRYDAVFSNAVLHWIQPPEPVVQAISSALKPGGRFVAKLIDWRPAIVPDRWRKIGEVSQAAGPISERRVGFKAQIRGAG